jgi:hypothetical protein
MFFLNKKMNFVISFQFGYLDLITWTASLVSLSKLTLVFWLFFFNFNIFLFHLSTFGCFKFEFHDFLDFSFIELSH